MVDPTTGAPAPMPTAPAAPAVPARMPAPEAPPPPTTDDAPAEPKPGKPFSWREDFAKADKDHDGKLGKSELKLAGAKNTDLDKDGKVEYREYRSAQTKANSFEGLDADKNGTLDAKELAKMQRFDDRQYGDGAAVTKEQFLETREAELRDNREADRRAHFEEGLTKGEARKMQRFAGEDGKLDADEYVAGKKQLWREFHEGRRDDLFEAAGGKGKSALDLSSKEAKKYAGYDADGDGKVTKQEFEAGYKADLQAVREQRRLCGEIGEGLQNRMAYGADTFANEIDMPANGEELHAKRDEWFISQYGTKYNTQEDVPGWDNANCGPTSLTMVATAFGKIDPSPAEADAAIERSRRMMGDAQSERDGTSGEGIARGAEAYGLDAKIVNNVTQKDIENELAKGRLPVVNGNVIRPDGSYGGGHFYVVTKIKDGKAYLNDPYSKTGPSVVPVERLMHSINSHWSHRIISIGEKK